MPGNPCAESAGSTLRPPSAPAAPGQHGCCGGPNVSVDGLALARLGTGVHLAASERPCLVLVELTSAMAVGATGGVDDDVRSATARVVHYSRADNAYAVDTDVRTIVLYDTLARHDGSGDLIGPAALRSGDRAWVYFNAQSARWELTRYPVETMRFELTAGLSPGGSAAAVTVEWNGSSYAATSTAITVYDALNAFTAGSGSRGLAVYHADVGRWEVTQLGLASAVCLTVLTDVVNSGGTLVFERKQICLPATATVASLSSLSIDDCCCGDDTLTGGGG